MCTAVMAGGNRQQHRRERLTESSRRLAGRSVALEVDLSSQ